MLVCAEKEVIMKNRLIGNHKHFNILQRIIIERGLSEGKCKSCRVIAEETEVLF